MKNRKPWRNGSQACRCYLSESGAYTKWVKCCWKVNCAYVFAGYVSLFVLLTTLIHVSTEFGGFAANMVRAADHSAVKLVKLVLMHFSGQFLA